jgi:hypothetical protein
MSTFSGEMFSCQWLSNGLVDFKNEYIQTKYPCSLQTHVCAKILRAIRPKGVKSRQQFNKLF